MERPKKIVDASVGVKWFSEEEKTREAEILLRQHIAGEIQIVVPDLFFYEVMNALRYKKSSNERLKEVKESLFKFQFSVESVSNEMLENAIVFALEFDLSIYDAIYIALAKLVNGMLITEDKKILSSKNSLVKTLN